MFEQELLVSELSSIKDTGFLEEYYLVTYHLPGQRYKTAYFNDREDLRLFLHSIKEKFDFCTVEYCMRRSLLVKNILYEEDCNI